jgi:dienelactone hydrolase
MEHERSPQSGSPGAQRFTVIRDGVRLAGVWLQPAGDGPFPAVIFVHGRGSGKDSPRNVVIAQHLADVGIAAVLFDLSGHGESSSDPRDGDASYVDDVAAVAAWVRSHPRFDNERIGVAGSSLGAVIAVQALIAGRIRPATMVLRAPPLEACDFAAIDVPSLVLIGTEDPLLPGVREGAARSHAVTLAVVSGAGHLFEEPGALQRALDLTVTWFQEKLARAVAAGSGGRQAS